ncbi:MAG: zinc ribbon domain-containing protein [Dissulfurispiraceae bacterium]|nr:zinc ribbon domain-containing protein [Dissulfurispiraceae bacterium]
MPVYEYLCKDCGHEFENNQSMHEAPLTSCPSCSGSIKRKISGGSGFIIKSQNPSSTQTPRCGKIQTCCGSHTPCSAPACGN